MIELIINTYLIVLISIGLTSLIIFIIGFSFILKLTYNKSPPIQANSIKVIAKNSEAIQQEKPSLTITSHDIKAIAGDDIVATQLDLARAYMETGKKSLAKKMLEYVAKQGNAGNPVWSTCFYIRICYSCYSYFL